MSCIRGDPEGTEPSLLSSAPSTRFTNEISHSYQWGVRGDGKRTWKNSSHIFLLWSRNSPFFIDFWTRKKCSSWHSALKGLFSVKNSLMHTQLHVKYFNLDITQVPKIQRPEMNYLILFLNGFLLQCALFQ